MPRPLGGPGPDRGPVSSQDASPKSSGVWPVTRLFGFGPRESNYTTLLMSTGLTFGTICALFGLDPRLHRSGR